MATAKEKAQAAPIIEPSYTIDAFCIAEGISVPHYYRLRAEGLAPKEMRTGACVHITHRARMEWQRMIEARSQDASRERASAKGRHAVSARRAKEDV